MEVVVKAWGDVVAKIKDKNGIYNFSLSPYNKLDFSPIKLKEKGVDYEFSHMQFLQGLPGMISDSLPGVYGKEYLDEFFLKHFKFKPSYLETLQFLHQNTMGALTYEPEYKKANNRTNAIFDAQELYSETKKAIQGDADFSINEIIAISNSAASGARPKAIVGFNPKTEKMYVGTKYEALPEGFIHSMVKFDNLMYKNTLNGVSDKERASQTKGEYLYSLVAKKVGINMSNTYLIESDSNYHFVTERFDIKTENNNIVRKHMHSLSGIMHHNPAESSFDYMNLFKVGEKLNVPYEDKEQFFKTMLFNLIFGNRDDHSRNFSYLMDSDGKWSGAPAYDLTYSSNRKHQMLFNYTDGFKIKREHIQMIANEHRINNPLNMVDEMIEVKNTLLYDLSIQYDLEDWYNEIIDNTKNILLN